MKHAYDTSRQRRATLALVGSAVLLACVLGFVLDRLLELAA
ncbi:hypothetical protein [Sphingomonas nostoxanthinifaciens]|nr:hypothetical protein [Sphingomonas nostoxanthinifaciens]